MTKAPNREWISNKLAAVTKHADDLVALNPDVTNEYRPLTALKLLVLSAGVELYTRIVPGKYEHSYYIDLFAGAGATEIRGASQNVVGSPIIAPVLAHEDFREYHFVELESEKATALQARLDYMDEVIDFPRERCQVHNVDANDFAHEFMDEMREELGSSYKGLNLFSFIDPEGMDPRWHVTRRLADVYGDMLIHYPESAVNRDLETQKARSYFPDDRYLDLPSEDDREKYFCESLESCDNTDITIPIRIESGDSGGNYHYDLIYATRETRAGSPYQKAMKHMQQKIEPLDGDDIKHVFRGLEGNEAALDEFMGGGTGEPSDKRKDGERLRDYYQ